MEKFIINGGKKLQGEVSASGAKNVALKALVAACLTDEEVTIDNIPLISDFFVMADIIEHLGGEITINGHTAKIHVKELKRDKISLDKAAEIRTSVMFLAPLLARLGRAIIPNPGGCRIGARPIDRTVDGLKKMGVNINYSSDDGYFHAEVMGIENGQKTIKGAHYRFEKTTHTGTETLLLVSVLADGETILENAAEEPEVDDLIELLNKMGAQITREENRKIRIIGVKKLHGVSFTITPDRNEIVTLAIAAILTNGEITVKDVPQKGLTEFLEKLKEANGGYEKVNNSIRFFAQGKLKAVDVTTAPFPGFMTDWQGPWAILMTQAEGTSVVHETVYENRFGYVSELKKMGARIDMFRPKIENPAEFYNFNTDDDKNEYSHAIKVQGPRVLHNAVVEISDLRAGATLVLASLVAQGESVILGIKHLDRGYEKFEKRLAQLGADIKRIEEE